MGQALAEARQGLATRDDAVAEGERGFYLQFEIPVAERGAVEGLENKPKAIELVAVRPPAEGDELISATVFVPERSADFFARKIEAYRDEVSIGTQKGPPIGVQKGPPFWGAFAGGGGWALVVQRSGWSCG